MIRIVVAGVGKEQILKLVQAHAPDRVQAVVKSDMEAALAIKSGKAEYYIGACFSGAGGALAVATGLLGSAQVARLSGTGAAPRREDVQQAVHNGKRAFGLATTHIDIVVPILLDSLLERHAAAQP